MSRKFLIPLLTAVFLAAPAAFGPATPLGFSGSAQATTNYNSSKSNVYKMTSRKPHTTIKGSGVSKNPNVKVNVRVPNVQIHH
jgi:hypothetical protein